MKIKQKPNLNGSAIQRLASRVAAIHFPTTANSVFDKMRQAQLDMYGNYGLANDPRQRFQAGGGFTSMADPESTQKMKKRQIASVSLPSLGEADYDNVPGLVSRTAGGNTKFVDDKEFPVTLSQILGSRMLSQEQLRAASIQNVSQMFNVHGAKDENEKQEIYYMFQRMMLEGFIRGVDITRDIPKQKAFDVTISDNDLRTQKVIGLSTQRGVKLRGSFWRNKDDASKMALFYHEIGHELMNKPHEGSGMMKSGGNSISARTFKSTKEAYNAYMNDFFDASNSRGFEHLRTPVHKDQEAKYNPSWFPSVTGVEGGYMPSGGASSAPSVTNNYAPVTQSGMDLRSEVGGARRLSAPQSENSRQVDASPAAPQESFSGGIQGMADTGVQAPSLQGIAGNLVNKAG